MNVIQQQYIQFEIDHEKYAIHISEINEIIKMQDISQIPNAVPYVKGVINLRGMIVPVISLRRLFGMPEDDYSKHTRIVVVNQADETIGIIVDRVDKVTTFTDIQPAPDRVRGISGINFTGMGIIGEDIAGILELNRVLVKEGGTHEQN